MGLRVSLLCLVLSLSSCSGGGGGGIFTIISSNVDNGAVWEINRPIEFLFNDQVDLNTANLTTISIIPLAPVIAGAGTALQPGPVIGQFSLKSLATTDPNYNKIVVFQPACPPATLPSGAVNLTNTGGAFEPATATVTFPYRIEVLSTNQTNGPVVKSVSGKKLNLGMTRNFTTQPASSPYVDTLPTPLASTVAVTNFPDFSSTGETVSMNALTDPVVFTVILDQAVLPSSFSATSVLGSFQLLYDSGSGVCNTGCSTAPLCDPVPATYTLSNCNLTGATTVTIVPLGTLPPGATVVLIMDKDLEDVSGQKNFDDVVLATGIVESKASTQMDMVLEEFDDAANFDSTNASSFFPSAVWSGGYLQAAEPLPGLSVEPGVDLTISTVVSVNTTQAILTGLSATDGSTVNINVVDGVLKVQDLVVASGGQLVGFGPNPLTILASGTVTVQDGGLISVRGGDSPTSSVQSFSLTNAATPDPGGVGQCGGGDGGAGSPNTASSDAKGGDGAGPSNVPGAGGKGGDSSISTFNPYPRAGGGGGGTWNHSANANFLCGTTTSLNDCNCVQILSNGTTGTPTSGKGTNINGQTGRFGTALDVVTGSSPAAGGVAGGALFADANTINDFIGVGASGSSAPFTVLRGEAASFIGGSGGGAGGDSIPSTGASLPAPANWDFANLDLKGGSGGGGGGVLIIRALGTVTIDGEINADGGDGGGGVPTDQLDRVGGGGGGGAAGAIIIMSAQSVVVGSAPTGSKRPKIHAWGGLPGAGNRANCYQGGNSLQNTPAATNTTAAGGAGGRGLIQFHIPRKSGANAGEFITVLPDGVTPVNSLVIDGVTKTINTGAAGPNQLATIPTTITISPPPYILAPDYGNVSVARSNYFYTGLANASAPTTKPDYYLSPDGGSTGAPFTSIGSGQSISLTAGATQSLVSNASSTLMTVLGVNSVQVTSSTLYNIVSSNPAILQDDLLTIGSTNYIIASASAPSTNVVVINTESSSGDITAAGTWSVKRRYYSIDTPGSSQALPPGSTVMVDLDVRTENSACSPGQPKATYTGGDSEKYIRFNVTFTIGGTLSPQSPRPRLSFLKTLFDY